MTAIVKAISKEDYIRERIFWVLAVAILAAGSIYGYLFFVMSVNATASVRNTENLNDIKNKYQDAESRYLAIISDLDIQKAYDLGFVDEGSSDIVNSDVNVLAKR